MLTVFTSAHFLVFLTNNTAQEAQEKPLKEKHKIRTALMRVIFRMHKLQAHTWHSALLRKQHCCLPSPSGTERDTPRVIFVLLSLSICLESRTDSLPSLPLRIFIFESEILAVSGMWQSQSLFASKFIIYVLLAATPDTQCQVLRYLAGGFGDQQSESPVKISWVQWSLTNLCFV